MNHEKFGTGNIVSKISRALNGQSEIQRKAVKDRVDHAKSLKGGRKETEKERTVRIARENETILQERIDAATAKEHSLSEYAAACHAESTVRTEHEQQLETVASLRATVSTNPQNPALQLRLLREERVFLNEGNRLAAAEKVTAEANDSLETANQRLIMATQATPDSLAGNVSEAQRQLNYAAAIEDTIDWSTLSTGPNNRAAHEIRKNAARNDLQKAVAAVAGALKREG